MRYKYQGSTETWLSGYGIVKPGEIITVDFEINNPLFRKLRN
jgi:hypothetical protein